MCSRAKSYKSATSLPIEHHTSFFSLIHTWRASSSLSDALLSQLSHLANPRVVRKLHNTGEPFLVISANCHRSLEPLVIQPVMLNVFVNPHLLPIEKISESGFFVNASQDTSLLPPLAVVRLSVLSTNNKNFASLPMPPSTTSAQLPRPCNSSLRRPVRLQDSAPVQMESKTVSAHRRKSSSQSLLSRRSADLPSNSH